MRSRQKSTGCLSPYEPELIAPSVFLHCKRISKVDFTNKLDKEAVNPAKRMCYYWEIAKW